MWMLSFIPDVWFTYAVHGIFIFGLAGYVAGAFASKLPFISTYGGIVKIIGGLLLIAGLILEGYSYGTSSYRKAAEDYRKQIEVAEEKAKDANLKLSKELKNKIDLTQTNTNENINAIQKYVTDDCKLSNAAVSLHNSSSQNEVPSSTIGTITGTSNIKTPELLNTVTENYGTCHETREKLKAWQDWYKTQKQIYESVK
jgi:hypothetical protein